MPFLYFGAGGVPTYLWYVGRQAHLCESRRVKLEVIQIEIIGLKIKAWDDSLIAQICNENDFYSM
jgi:hypothetical protein